MKKIKYWYYLHGTNDDSKQTEQSIFNVGLKCRYFGSSTGCPQLQSTATPFRNSVIENVGLEQLSTDYLVRHDFKRVYIINIPYAYMPYEHNNQGEVTMPIPFWKKTRDRFGKDHLLLCPHLVYGSFSMENGLVLNDNYTETFDPSGFVFDDQVGKNLQYIHPELYEWILSRNDNYYEQLHRSDKINKIFDIYVEAYKKAFSAHKKWKR